MDVSKQEAIRAEAKAMLNSLSREELIEELERGGFTVEDGDGKVIFTEVLDEHHSPRTEKECVDLQDTVTMLGEKLNRYQRLLKIINKMESLEEVKQAIQQFDGT